MTTDAALRLKKYAYLAFLTPALLPPLSWHLGRVTGAADAWAWFTLLYVFGLIPVLDLALGKDASNPRDEEVTELSADPWYRRLTLACLPVMIAVLIFGAWVFAHSPDLSWVGRLGWAASIGLVGGALGINAAHELIHKNTPAERFVGGVLLSLVCYGGFKIEHVRGHHVNVSTPDDASSARYDESLYHFLPRAVGRNVLNAFRLEAGRLRRLGRSPWGPGNELFGWYALSAAVGAALTAVLGLPGLVFFLLQSVCAFSFLEIVNYIEHYGLRRRRLPGGRYERTSHLHSWNSNYLLTNLLLFQLQRHSDHHAHPRRRYQVLRHFDDSPQLPAGYATMMVLALVPPLWRRVMNPRVRAFYRDAPELLQAA